MPSAQRPLSPARSAPAHRRMPSSLPGSATTSGARAVTTSSSRTTRRATHRGVGRDQFSTSAFGYTLLVNTSQSKPMLGSATPQLDLTFTVTSAGSAANVFLYASDTDFLTGGMFSLTPSAAPIPASAAASRVVPGAARATPSSSFRAQTCSPRSVRSRPRRSRAHATGPSRRRESVFADDRDDSLTRDRRNEYRRPQPAGLGDPGAQHLGVDVMGPALVGFVALRRIRRR